MCVWFSMRNCQAYILLSRSGMWWMSLPCEFQLRLSRELSCNRDRYRITVPQDEFMLAHFEEAAFRGTRIYACISWSARKIGGSLWRLTILNTAPYSCNTGALWGWKPQFARTIVYRVATCSADLILCILPYSCFQLSMGLFGYILILSVIRFNNYWEICNFRGACTGISLLRR